MTVKSFILSDGSENIHYRTRPSNIFLFHSSFYFDLFYDENIYPNNIYLATYSFNVRKLQRNHAICLTLRNGRVDDMCC